jgi:hypothetical protein
MATTRKKPAAATKAVAAPRQATKAVATPAENEPAPGAATSTATAVIEAPRPAAGPHGIERRRSVREKLVAPAVLQPSSGDASVDRGVQVQDLSLGGVGFVASEKFVPRRNLPHYPGQGPPAAQRPRPHHLLQQDRPSHVPLRRRVLLSY